MGANFYGELIIRVTSDTKQAEAGLDRMAAKTAATGNAVNKAAATQRAHWERVGLGLQNIGRTMTQFVTLPVVAGLGLATVAAYKFEDQMLKVQNLTGLTAEQTAKYGDAIKSMAGQVGVVPSKLAEAFYFIASSGFKGAEAIKVLEASAKASMVGLGDVMVTADAVTSAVNAYGHSNLSAAHMVDVLMKTIEVGKAEPEALASSLGRIMPVAQGLKVPIEDLGGMIAGLTLTGLSSAEAVTALRGAMMALTAPTKMSLESYKDLGMTYKQVTDIIAKKGLLYTLQMLYEKVDGDRLAMRKMIPNVRALNGVLSLLGPNYQRNLEVIDQVNDAQGKLNETVKASNEKPIVKLRKAWASLVSSFTDIGQVILPLLADFVAWIAKLVEPFSELPKSVQYATLAILTFTATLGPIAMVSGSVIRSLNLISSVMGTTAAAATEAQVATAGLGTSLFRFTMIAAGWGAIAVGVGAFTYALVKANQALYDSKNILSNRNAADILSRSGYKTNLETNVKVKLITGDADSKIARLQRLKGNIVLTVDDVRAWSQVEALNAYVNDPSKWVIPASMHLTPKENLAALQETIGQFGTKPVSMHTQISPRQLRLQAKMITDIFEKIPSVEIPAKIKMGKGSDKDYLKWWKSLTDKQRLIIEPQIRLGAKVAADRKRVQGLEADLRRLGKMDSTPKIRGDMSELRAKLKNARAALRASSREYAEMRIKGVDEYSSQVNAARVAINSLPSEKVIRIIAQGPGPISMHSLGAVVKRPEVTLVGEDGPEVILPLTKPTRMKKLIKEAGIENYMQRSNVYSSAPAAASSSTPAVVAGPAEVHYHSHVTVPQGIVVDDTERFARQLAPWQERELDTAYRRRQRGLAGL